MITIQGLEFSYWFSYGKNNKVDFNKQTLTQIKGKNGHGKSSIALILQELFYGKNSKNIKKQDLINRKYPKETLYARSQFTDGKYNYDLLLERKNSIKLTLLKDDQDISSHTAKGTYDTIEKILNMDFKTFSQLTYQSSISSLQFLTATDLNRKLFLISLFNLDKYTRLHDILKEESKNIGKLISEKDGSIENITSWINKHENEDLTEKHIEETIIKIGDDKLTDLARLKDELKNINEINNKINRNNAYIQMRDNISMDDLQAQDPKLNQEIHNINHDIDQINKSIVEYESVKLNINKKIKELEKELKIYQDIPEICPNCNQKWPVEKNEEKIINIQGQILIQGSEITSITNEVLSLSNMKNTLMEKLKELQERMSIFEKSKKQQEEFERLTNLIDNTIQENVLDKNELENQITSIELEIKAVEKAREKRLKEIQLVSAHNSKVKVIKDQLVEYNKQLEEEFEYLSDYEDKYEKIEILKKTFSNTGLIAYKLEYLVKDLETEINRYLGETSNGKFQLEFNLKGEKLNIDIINNGITVSIDSLSEGEKGRVNVATLLSIRKMMSQISSTRINILFLDEIMGVLDTEGKESLVEILLKENLNTFLVSHEYQHPLVPSINIVKENEESFIEWN